MKNETTVTGYIRVSAHGGPARESISIDAQRAAILAAYPNAVIFSDEFKSGRKMNRPGLDAALAHAKNGGVFVVYSLSRMARSTKDLIEISELLEKQNCDFVSLTEKIDTSCPTGRMVFRMLAALAEFERDIISERTSAALAHKRANGEYCGSKIPFGFAVRDGKLIPIKHEQETIKRIRKMAAAGCTQAAIADALNADGVKTKYGRTWRQSTIRKILGRS